MFGISIASPPNPILSPQTLISNPKSAFHGVRIHTPFAPHGTLSSRTRSSSCSVVMMAKKEEELKEIRAMSTEQINEEVVDLKGELLMLRLQKSAREDFKSSEFRRMRRMIARMLTVKREREIEEGVGKRLSRKLDRQWKKSIVMRPPPSLVKMLEEQKAAEAEKTK
ncbi:hypothetical protein Syun_013599 [Stephania yunnanensis]|uniref:Large ribosomal subunit protein uL29c n=1 Tax=Stephania yunnanensis TaxID=152371 RepID=A0AAP0JI58_9MAGN